MSIDTNERANLVGNGENDGDGDHPMTSTSSNNLSELTQEGEPGNTSSSSSSAPPYADLRDPAPLVEMFQSEFCRRHGLPKEDLLSVAVGLGGKGGALGAIERARRMMVLGDQLGNVREWQELPVSASCISPVLISLSLSGVSFVLEITIVVAVGQGYRWLWT